MSLINDPEGAAPEAYWIKEKGSYYPNPVSEGPWLKGSVIGRAICGLLGFTVERELLEPGWVPARFTADMFGLANFSQTDVECRVLHRGGRTKLVELELSSGGVKCAAARCQLLRQAEAPSGKVWSPDPWDVPSPERLADDDVRQWDWHLRFAEGGFGKPGRKRAWVKEYRELVAGVSLTPFVRAALACDFTSPVTNSGDRGLKYINTEATMHLHRLPAGEWIGFDVTDHQASNGISVGQARIYDELGPLGFGSAAALAQNRRAR